MNPPSREPVLAALAAFSAVVGLPVYSGHVGDHDRLRAHGAKIVSNIEGFPALYLRLARLAGADSVLIEHAAGWEELFPEATNLPALAARLRQATALVELVGAFQLTAGARPQSPGQFAVAVAVAVNQPIACA